MAKNKVDPTVRWNVIYNSSDRTFLEGSLDEVIFKLQDIKAKALVTNPKYTNFGIMIDHDEYDYCVEIGAWRPETAEEKLIRTNKHPAQIKAKEKQAAEFKKQAAEEVRRLCKKLKVQSPI